MSDFCLWEPYGGSLGVTRAAVWAGPLIAYMGRKDKLASYILKELQCSEPSSIFVNDAGSWGVAWEELLDYDGAGVVECLESWRKIDRCALWDVLATLAPLGGAQGVAQFLYLQARSIRGIPLYWRGGEWVSHRPNGTTKKAAQRQPPIPGKGGGRITAAGLAERVRKLVAHPWPEKYVWCTHATALPWGQLRASDRVFLDPPYQGCTPYEGGESRDNVLDLARKCAAAGAYVAVSEAVSLTSELGKGWYAVDLTAYGHGMPEWLTVHVPKMRRV